MGLGMGGFIAVQQGVRGCQKGIIRFCRDFVRVFWVLQRFKDERTASGFAVLSVVGFRDLVFGVF